MKKFILLIIAIAFSPRALNAQTVTDIDGNIYNTITIGTQVWTKENLRVTHYRNGDSIPNVADSLQWYNLTSGGYCNYDNNSNNGDIYGRLYNWYAIQDLRNIAPLGWHVPTYEDWDTLQIFAGYDLVAGGKLKEIGTSHWMSPNTGATDEYDFTALPGGQRADLIYSGTFAEITTQGYWWSSSEIDTVYPWGVNISYNSAGMTNWGASTRTSGFSVRLISDLASGINNQDIKEQLNIFPNPTKDKINIIFRDEKEKKIAVYNLQGKLLLQQEMKEISNQIDLSTFASGMYLIKITGMGIAAQKKIIKE